MQKNIHPERSEQNHQNTNDVSSYNETMQRLLRPRTAAECLYNACIKFYPDGAGGWYPVKRIVFNCPIYNPEKLELRRDVSILGTDFENSSQITKNRNEEPAFWKKSFNRARQQCFDYLMCNPDIDTFLTFTVDPSEHDSFDYGEIVGSLSNWLDNRVRRKGLKYILVPERHKSGAIHLHGLSNFDALKLVDSGYYRYKKYNLLLEQIPKNARKNARKIYNVDDLSLGFSTAIRMSGESAHEKVAKYIWKYMTKQDGQKIGGRFYLHGGKMEEPKYVYENASFGEAEGEIVSYSQETACKIETFFS